MTQESGTLDFATCDAHPEITGGDSSGEYGWMSVSVSDKKVLKNLSQMGEKLKELKQKMLEAEAEADRAKKEYEHYAHVLVPQEMFSAGVDSVGLASGGKLSLRHNFYCQPNKNPEDRKAIVEWLRENGGGHLVETEVSVSSDMAGFLRDNGVPYVESASFNTNKLKSFLKDKIGATSGVQQIRLEDIPQCVHFQEVTVVDIDS